MASIVRSSQAQAREPAVGASAPPLVLGGRAVLAGPGPRVLAFARRWTPGDADVTLRAHLRGLGAQLIVIAPEAAWSLGADDAVEALDASPAERAAATVAYDVDHDALFVIDGRGVVRFSHGDPSPVPLGQMLGDALAIAGDAMRDKPELATDDRVLFTRREWSVTCLVIGCTTAVLAACKQQGHDQADRKPPAPAPAPEIPATIAVTLTINGQQKKLAIDPRASLLDTLRETLGLTGTKKGCDAGQCGACTVLLGDNRVLSCLTLAAMAQGKNITTIEGLAKADGTLHPMQQAFCEHDGLQCGYCTPGQIISAVALVREGRATTDDEVREQMSGNICRCGAYPNIVAAIQSTRRA